MMRAFQRGQRSLFGEILDWMLAPLLLLWPMSVAVTWLVAHGLADIPYDRELEARARWVAARVSLPPSAGTPARAQLSPDQLEVLRLGDSDRVWVQVLAPDGRLVLGDAQVPGVDDGMAESAGARFRYDEIDGEAVRVVSVWVGGAEPGSQALVQVAETRGKRTRLGTDIAKGVILSQFVVLPVAVLLVWLALARGLTPLADLQRSLRRRDVNDLSPIAGEDVPEEVAPLVVSINDLLERLERTIGTQKHFLADAAHQLKTPLAGLRTQAELAQREIDAGADPAAVRKSLQQIARSSQRAAHMVSQLLTMARAEDQEQTRQTQDVHLVRLATETVRDFVPKALESSIDLGFEGPDRDDAHTLVRGQPVLLRELIRNLVDNALQYTPRGGVVTVRIVPDPFGQVVVLQVEDSGPGIPHAERELVFQPFYRVLGTNVDGSGLGLAIVKEIAQRHGADVTIEDAQPRAQPPGTRFTLRLPVVPLGTTASGPA